MNIKVEITPERDSFNSYPQPIEFLVYDDVIGIVVNDRTLTFKHEDILRLVSVCDAGKS